MAELNSTLVKGRLRVTDEIIGPLNIINLSTGTNGQFLSMSNGVPTWVANPNSNTKDTTGTSNSDAKLFLVGGASQNTGDSSPVTYSNANVYMKDGTMYLAKTIAASGTTDTRPALIVGTGLDTSGNIVGGHIAISPGVIQSKATATTTGRLDLNPDGGNIYFNGNNYNDAYWDSANHVFYIHDGNNNYQAVVLNNDPRLDNARTPEAHAVNADTYGLGTSSLYGHVKLGDADQNGKTAADGVAAPNGHTHSQYSTTDTKDTTGSSNSDAKLYLIGAGSQATGASSPTTYSYNKVYETAGQLDAIKFRVAENITLQYDSSYECLDFVFGA